MLTAILLLKVLLEAPPPPDIFHDPNTVGLVGIFVGIVAIIVAIGVGVYQVRQARTRRQLEYTMLSNAPIVSINTSIADQVEIDIKVRGVSAKDAHLVVLNVKNTGKASVHAADYFEPLMFEFGTKVLSASVLNTTPPALIKPDEVPTFLTLASQSIGFPPFPLNPDDTVQISVLLEGAGKMEVRGRLDQGRIVEYSPRKTRVLRLIVLASILVLTGGLSETVAIARLAGTVTIVVEAVYFILVALAIGSLIIEDIRAERSQKW